MALHLLASELAQYLQGRGFNAIVHRDADLFDGDEFVRCNNVDLQIAGQQVYAYTPDGASHELAANDVAGVEALLGFGPKTRVD